MVYMEKICCFIGHRKIDNLDKVETKTKEIVLDLILNKNVKIFLFGSNSEFDDLCLKILSQLKEKFIDLKRIGYTCKSEGIVLQSEKEKFEKLYLKIFKSETELFCVDEEFEYKTKYTAGKASYIERNQAMINDSDYCVFYYDKNYKPKMRKHSKKDIFVYQPKSGTKIAYDYAIKKKKQIINVFEFI